MSATAPRHLSFFIGTTQEDTLAIVYREGDAFFMGTLDTTGFEFPGQALGRGVDPENVEPFETRGSVNTQTARLREYARRVR